MNESAFDCLELIVRLTDAPFDYRILEFPNPEFDDTVHRTLDGHWIFILPLTEDNIGELIRHAWLETLNNPDCREVICVIPAETNSAWFHAYVLPHADIEFLEGYDYPAIVATFSKLRQNKLSDICRQKELEEPKMAKAPAKKTPAKKPITIKKAPAKKTPKGDKPSPTEEWKTAAAKLEAEHGVKNSTLTGWLNRHKIPEEMLKKFFTLTKSPKIRNLLTGDRAMIKMGLIEVVKLCAAK